VGNFVQLAVGSAATTSTVSSAVALSKFFATFMATEAIRRPQDALSLQRAISTVAHAERTTSVIFTTPYADLGNTYPGAGYYRRSMYLFTDQADPNGLIFPVFTCYFTMQPKPQH